MDLEAILAKMGSMKEVRLQKQKDLQGDHTESGTLGFRVAFISFVVASLIGGASLLVSFIALRQTKPAPTNINLEVITPVPNPSITVIRQIDNGEVQFIHKP